LTVINEYVSDQYLKINLHRSVSGATLNKARIPSVTIELGGQKVVNQASTRAAATALRNVMRWAGMLPGELEPITGVTVINPGYPVRRTTNPRVPLACIIQPLVEPGDIVQAGDPLGRMVDIYGRPVGPNEGYLHAEYDGFVMGLFTGVAFYPNDSFIALGIRDDSDLVVPIPDA
jgi:predicted deacylase